MSPMPRMREAIRSGWKVSKSASFSPVDANMMGAPVTCRTDSAAPPRASPSSLVSTTPGEPDAVAERLRGGHRVLADHRVDDEQDLVGHDRVPDVDGLLHHLGVHAEPAGGVDDDDVVQPDLRLPARRRAPRPPDRRRRCPAPGRTPCTPAWLADDLQLGHRVRPLQVAGDEQRRVALALQPERELAGQRRLAGALQAGQHDHRRRVLRVRAAAGSRRRGCRRAPR